MILISQCPVWPRLAHRPENCSLISAPEHVPIDVNHASLIVFAGLIVFAALDPAIHAEKTRAQRCRDALECGKSELMRGSSPRMTRENCSIRTTCAPQRNPPAWVPVRRRLAQQVELSGV
jgi:hypothetical protein